MTDLNTATTEEILTDYKTGIDGLTETLGIIALGIENGILSPDVPLDAEVLVSGFRASLDIVNDLPEEIRLAVTGGKGLQAIEAARLVIDLHDQAVAAGRKSTPRSLGLAIGAFSVEVIRLNARNGDQEAADALVKHDAQIQELGL